MTGVQTCALPIYKKRLSLIQNAKAGTIEEALTQQWEFAEENSKVWLPITKYNKKYKDVTLEIAIINALYEKLREQLDNKP